MTLTKTTNSRLKCVERYFENKGTRVGPSRRGQKKIEMRRARKTNAETFPLNRLNPPKKPILIYPQNVIWPWRTRQKKKCFSFFLHGFAASGKVI